MDIDREKLITEVASALAEVAGRDVAEIRPIVAQFHAALVAAENAPEAEVQELKARLVDELRQKIVRLQ